MRNWWSKYDIHLITWMTIGKYPVFWVNRVNRVCITYIIQNRNEFKSPKMWLKLPAFYDMDELIPFVQCGLSIYTSIIWICLAQLDPECTHRVINNPEFWQFLNSWMNHQVDLLWSMSWKFHWCCSIYETYLDHLYNVLVAFLKSISIYVNEIIMKDRSMSLPSDSLIGFRWSGPPMHNCPYGIMLAI